MKALALLLAVFLISQTAGCASGSTSKSLTVAADGTGRALSVVRLTALSNCSVDGALEAEMCRQGDVNACSLRDRCENTFRALRPGQSAVLIAKLAIQAADSDDKVRAAVETAKRALDEALAIWQALQAADAKRYGDDPRRSTLIAIIIEATSRLIQEILDIVAKDPQVDVSLQESELRALDAILAAYRTSSPPTSVPLPGKTTE